MHRLKKIETLGVALVLGMSMGLHPVVAQEEPLDAALEDELQVEPLAMIPANVMAAARGAAPDVAFQSADSLWIDDRRVYRIQGRLFREVWTVHVTDAGQVIKVNRNNQDD